MNKQTPDELEVAPESVKAAMDTGREPLLVDCRTPSEHATAKIEGAMLVPMDEVPDRLAELQGNSGSRDRPIVVFCHHGGRSLEVTRYLRQAGFTQARSMAGGIDAWSVAVDPAVSRYQ